MKRNLKSVLYTIPVALVGGGVLVGSMVWAANERHQTSPSHAAAPKLIVSESPIERTGSVPGSYASIVKKVTPSVVQVDTTVRPKLTSSDNQLPDMPFLRRFFGDDFQWNVPDQPMQMPPRRGVGSGVIVTKDGYLLTNNHVVDGADEVRVTLQDGREFTAKVVGTDPKSDVAVLKVGAEDLPAIELADSGQVQVGDVVLAVGNPFGIGTTVTMGMVSAMGRAPLGLDYEDFIQTDAAINPGNSGGALVDIQGRLVGINTAILSRSGGNQGIGFAIPANLARQIMVSLVQYGRVVRGYLGVTIQDVTPALAKKFDLEKNHGALVSEVMPDSPASRAGLDDGDVILDFDGAQVGDSRHLKLQVAQTRPDTTVPVKVLRDGKTVNLKVKVGELAGERQLAQSEQAAPSNDTGTLEGVAVSDLDKDARQRLQVPERVEGALITNVQTGSAADEAGLKPGDVILEINRQKVNSANDAVRLTEKTEDKLTLVRVWNPRGTHYVVVDERNEQSS